jgi:hypothetical protein
MPDDEPKLASDNPQIPINCPTCGQPLKWLKTLEPNAWVYSCGRHGMWKLNDDGLTRHESPTIN